MPVQVASATCASGATGSQTVTTSMLVFRLTVGASETMYSPQQVRTKHVKTGEVMVGGQMQGSGTSNMSGSSSMQGMGSSMRHVEVHICQRAGNKVVTGPIPTIKMTNGQGAAQTVPVAVMEGVGEGIKDLHFGNNVSMTAGRSYAITVTEAGDRAVFHVTAMK